MRAVKGVATGLLFLVVALCLAAVCVPPFLDRVYYRGAVSDHFDGARFFNPGSPARPGFSPARMARFMLRSDRAAWPESVPVSPGYAPAAATPCPPTTGAIVENWARCVPAVDPAGLWVTWIGHSTALVQAQGLSILTDPVWSDHAGPLGVGPKRVRAPGIRLNDLPKIDVVLVSHNHYDHMDIPTLKRLWDRDKPLIVTSLGNDAILRASGISAVARDWGGRVPVRPGVAVIVEPAHHWGSRWASDRNRALWSGFTVTLPGGNMFFAGDTGLDDAAWVRAARADGPYRLAILPIGAYDPRAMMRESHLDPAEAVGVMRGLDAAYALAVHWGTFQLSNEGIDAPPAAMRAAGLGDRFRALQVGQPWAVPPLARAVTAR